MKFAHVKTAYLFVAVFAITLFVAKPALSQSLNTPYPIIFVHGLCSDYQTWGSQDGQFDNIIDYLEGAGLKSGGNLNFSLNYLRDTTHFNTTKEQDVHWYEGAAGFGDFYTMNFNVRSTPNVTEITTQAIVNQLDGINITTNQISVTPISQFLVNDILRIDDEFMLVTAINGNILTVKRHIIGTLAAVHSYLSDIYNLSNESNQASIAKQGYALKLAIDAILQTTKAKKVILVGHSMGGLAAREYLRTYANNNVAKIITIGTPHYGSNVTELPNSVINSFLPGFDGRVEAARDLRSDINDNLAPYLFGGNESDITGFYSNDVNCNGESTDYITPLNGSVGYAPLDTIAHTWIASIWTSIKNDLQTALFGVNDGVVLTKSEYISSADTLMTNRRHDDEPADYYTLLRGLDEPDSPALAYEIAPSSTTKGFITFNQGNSTIEENPVDVDLFKFILPSRSTLVINIAANNLTGINTINLLDANQNTLKSLSDINQQITDDLDAGTYYIQINGIATHGATPSYQYPYTLTTATTVIPPATLSVSPGNLSYYDVVLNQNVAETVTLTNNGTGPISVTNLALTGTNADQFSITGPTTYNIAAGASQPITVNFTPTNTGPQYATLQITNNSTDNPVENIPLQGNGVPQPTQKLVIKPDKTYDFGNQTITESKAEIFNVLDTGSNKISVSNLSLIGPNANQFSISTQSGTSFSVNPNGGTTFFIVNFLPTSVGAKNAQLLIVNSSDDKSPADTINLYGNGTNSIYTGIGVNIVGYEYWFDNNYSSKVSASIPLQSLGYINTNFSTTGLNTGPHQLNVRYEDQNNQWSSVTSKVFFKPRSVITYEYWFDGNYAGKTDITVTPSQIDSIKTNISTVSLSTGQHTLNSRFKDDDGQWSSVSSRAFFKPRNIVVYEYWFDNNYAAKTDLPITAAPIGSINSDISTTSLSTGQHTLNSRFKDDDGQWGSVSSQVFYKPRNVVAYEYWFDSNYSAKVDAVVAPGQSAAISTNISAASLPSGQHTFNFRSRDDNGQWSTVTSRAFSKPRNLVVYEYWFDSNYASKVSVPITSTSTAVINGTIPTTLTAGAHRYNVRFKDDLGQWSSVKTDTVTVISKVATLAGLTLSSGTLAPVFASGTTGYTASEVNGVNAITITPTASNVNATITVNGTVVVSGIASKSLPLTVGPNTITIAVTAQDGTTKQTYTVIVTEAPSSNDNLAHLTPSKGTLSPAFSPTATTYTETVANSVSSITITPGAAVATSTIKVNGVALTSGSASSPISLKAGVNTITTVVTAQDGSTKTYTLTVTRLGANNANLSALTLSQGALSPAFASATASYTVTVANNITSLKVTPTASDPDATIKVNGTTVASGSPSGAIALSVGVNNISVAVLASNGTTTKTYTVVVSRTGSANANLSSFKPSKGTIAPGFSSATTSYTSSVANNVTSITITPTAADATATIKVNGTTVASGSTSGAVALSVGANTITTVVTAQDGVTKKTYTLTITRLPGTNANLSALAISQGTLSPAFASATASYTATVANAIASLTVTPTATDPDATIKVNGTTVASGSPSAAIALSVGANTITVAVLASNGTTTKSYAIVVSRTGSSNANLSSFKPSKGTIAPGFSSATTSYTSSVANNVTSITITPTSADANATIAINGTAVPSGTASGDIALAVGANTINTVVTAQDGVTTKTYTLTITRAPGSADSFDPGISVTKPTETPSLNDDIIAVRQGISPNGDGINDFLVIDGIQAYPDNKLSIMNRNGQLVYQASGYDNSSKVFDGHSNKNGQLQLPGTYFYQLDYTVKGITKHKTGFLVLKY